MSGRTRKPPKRFIEDDVGNTKENSVSKQVDTCILMIWVITRISHSNVIEHKNYSYLIFLYLLEKR